MASVRKFPSSQFWYAIFKVPTGKLDSSGRAVFKPKQRSTRTTDKSKALQLAISYERAAVNAATRNWSENSGRRFLAELQAITGIEVGQIEPIDTFLTRWVKTRQQGLARSSFERYEGVVVGFLDFLKHRRSAPLADISSRLMIDYRDAQLELGKSASTVNKQLSILSQAFSEATTMGMMMANPASGVMIKNARKRAQKRRHFTFAQFKELIRLTDPDYIIPGRATHREYRLHPDWQTFVMLLGYTGGRQQEVSKITWEQIDLERRRLWLVRTKTDDTHWIPIHKALADHLGQRRGSGPRMGYVLPYMATLKRRRISNAFRTQILPRIGITQEYAKNNNSSRTLAPYSIHSLRHSLNTWLAEAGVDETMRMKIVGHESAEVNRGYTHIEFEQVDREMSKLPHLQVAG
ncbi:MAG: site-specific integrase [Opitutaceae bacterium]|nr:site-specific integrase [Opitutaceae bacterium]